MKTIIGFMLVLFLAVAPAQAASLGLIVRCADDAALPPNFYVSTVNASRDIVEAYVQIESQWGNVLAFGDWLVDRHPGIQAWGGVAIDADSGLTIQALTPDGVLLASLTIDGNSAYAACGAVGWQPGAPSIAVTLVSDCQFIQIRDVYDHWHFVESNGEKVLLHYGESLIGNPTNGQSTDPADYRAIATPCPG